MKIKWIKSVKYAWAGIRHLMATEPNAKIHLLATGISLLLSFLLRINYLEFGLIILCIGLVWMAEGFNSAIERLADRITQQEDPLIKQAKDLSAGGVLLISATALIIGLIIFCRRLYWMFV